MTDTSFPPDALLLIATGCNHCPAVLEGLSRLLKHGQLGRLEVINLAVHPDAGQALGVRAVPWTRIGPFELEGLLAPAELADWAARAADGSGFGAYYRHLLEARRLPRVVELVRERPASLAELLADASAASPFDPGDAALLQAYADWRRGDQARVVRFTDSLIRSFGIGARPVSVARGLGLAAFDLVPPAKRELARQTMGLAGRLSRLARGRAL